MFVHHSGDISRVMRKNHAVCWHILSSRAAGAFVVGGTVFQASSCNKKEIDEIFDSVYIQRVWFYLEKRLTEGKKENGSMKMLGTLCRSGMKACALLSWESAMEYSWRPVCHSLSTMEFRIHENIKPFLVHWCQPSNDLTIALRSIKKTTPN